MTQPDELHDFSRTELYDFMANHFGYWRVFNLDLHTINQIKEMYSELYSIFDKIESDFIISNKKNTHYNLHNKSSPYESIRKYISSSNKIQDFIKSGEQVTVGDLGESSKKIKLEINEDNLENRSGSKKGEYLFLQVLKAVEARANDLIDSIVKDSPERLRISKPKEMCQIFLSHAYLDRVYTFSLFCYFYHKGIYLYIDWMHNQKITDGSLLKNSLAGELAISQSLVFLSTVNSELTIRGGSSIRQWCSWEIGLYYTMNNNNKFLIRSYLPTEGNHNSVSLNNIIYGNFKPITRINKGIGIE